MEVSGRTWPEISCNTFWGGLRIVLESPLSFKGAVIIAYARPLCTPSFFRKKDSGIFDLATSLSGFQELLTFSFIDGTAFEFLVNQHICACIHWSNLAYNNIPFCATFLVQPFQCYSFQTAFTFVSIVQYYLFC